MYKLHRWNKLLEGYPKGSHMVFFYNSQKEKHQIMFPFIQNGLEKEEAIIYLSDEQSVKQIVRDMSIFGIDVDRHEKTGALKVLNGEEWYVENETINKKSVLKKWMKALSDATKNGFSGLRVSSEPTYFFKYNILEPWMEYERSLPRRFIFPLTAVCRYKIHDLALHNRSYLLELIRVHSHSITSKSVHEINSPNFLLKSVDSTFKRILGESATQAVYHFLERKYELPKSSIGDNMNLFNEALDNLFGAGGNVLQREVLMEICSKLSLTCNLKA